LLKLLHPFIPFVTEVIFKELFNNEIAVAEMLYPDIMHSYIFEDSLKNIDLLINTVKSIRALKFNL
jgi:valyl-tRNA synthetase